MYRHILLPTDGSILSDAAITAAVGLARSLGARVTGLHVILPWHFEGGGVEYLGPSPEEYARTAHRNAGKFLAAVTAAAKAAGIACDCVTEESAHPHEAILAAAEKRGCDLVVMASHGRRGLRGFLLGSETSKVLAHAKLPVLVIR